MSDDDYVGKKILRYPLDLTGKSADNFVSGEPHTLVPHTNRVFVPDYGPFFGDTITLVDASTGKTLTPRVQYLPIQSVASATARSGQDVCGAVAIIDPAVSNNIQFSGQMTGGPYILMVQALIDMIATVDVDTRVFNYGEIVGKPNLFPVGHHLHDIGDSYGFEYLVYVLEDIRQAILNGNVNALDALRNYIDNLMATHKVSHDHDWLYYTKGEVWTKQEADDRYLKRTDYSNAITIDGPTSLPRGATGSFHITNYDIYSSYSAVLDGGAVSFYSWPTDQTKGNSAFMLTIPDNMPLGSQNLTIKCNSSSRVIPLMITDTGINKPALSGTLYDSDPTWVIAGSNFSVKAGNTDTLAACEWVVTNTSTGAEYYHQTIAGTNGGTITLTGLPVSTTFSAKVRYKGATLGWSDWSDPISVTTKDTYVIVVSATIEKPTITATPSTVDASVAFQMSQFKLSSGSDTPYSYDYIVALADSWLPQITAYDRLCNGSTAPSFSETLKLDTSYRISARFKGASGEYSDWSDYAVFKTRAAFVAMTGATTDIGTVNVATSGGGQPPTVTASPAPSNASGAQTYHWHYVSGDSSIACNSPNTAAAYFSGSGNATAYWACTIMEINAAGSPVYWETPSVKVVSGSGSAVVGTFQYPLLSATIEKTPITTAAVVSATPGSSMAIQSGSIRAIPGPYNADSCSYTWEYGGGTQFTINNQTSQATTFTYNWKYGDDATVTGSYRCKITQGGVSYYTGWLNVIFTTTAGNSSSAVLKSSLGTSGPYRLDDMDPSVEFYISVNGTWSVSKGGGIIATGTWCTGGTPNADEFQVKISRGGAFVPSNTTVLNNAVNWTSLGSASFSINTTSNSATEETFNDTVTVSINRVNGTGSTLTETFSMGVTASISNNS